MKRVVLLGIVCWCSAMHNVSADVDWRVSIKLIADADGNPPPGSFQNMTAQVTESNRLLNRFGRGYGFDVVEIVTLTGLSQWHNDSVTPGNRRLLQNAVRANPELYAYRSDAINIYVTVWFGLRHLLVPSRS